MGSEERILKEKKVDYGVGKVWKESCSNKKKERKCLWSAYEE